MRLFAYLLAMSCAVAQTGKLSADKQAKIESTISNFMAVSKAPGISAAAGAQRLVSGASKCCISQARPAQRSPISSYFANAGSAA